MRKYQVEQIKKHISGLYDVQWEIKHCMEEKTYQTADELVIACQELAIQIGNFIEQVECEGHVTVSHLESYCEVIFQVHEALQAGDEVNSDLLFEKLNNALAAVENSIKNDMKIRREAVFLPYKASMWDSLESVWKEAHADPDCDAYVIPIPYFDRNDDGTVKEMHYEGDSYPDYVPITKFDAFDFGAHRPDMIFIHNPYDGANFVTSVHPFFYSDNLKKYTDCLVYIPYFASAGGMSEGQAMCPAYLHVDYIVIQSEKFRNFYDASIPDEKFLAFGSPKFDSVIQKCQNPPKAPKEWQEKMTKADGSKIKVFFYNTSIGGMLENTDNFLKKVAYVFDCFEGRNDVCLLWRPHPLLESTFDSMRPNHKPIYEALKQRFIENKLGIYDSTPCMEDSIAMSDVYIGDAASSLVSLFGVAGKPLFILDNSIHSTPKEDSWKYIIQHSIRGDKNNRYTIIYGKKLFFTPGNDLHFHYLCDLPNEYAGAGYYQRAFAYKDKVFMIPLNAQDILVMDQNQRFHKIPLKREVEQAGVFSWFAYHIDIPEYLFLFPQQYPAMVRLNLDTEEVEYIYGVRDYNRTEVNGQKVYAAKWTIDDQVCIMNPEGTEITTINIRTLEISTKRVAFNRLLIGVGAEKKNDTVLWMIPYEGTVVTRWNRITGEMRDYDLAIDGMEAIDRQYKIPTTNRMIGGCAFYQGKVIFSPDLANKFVELDPESGEKREWLSPFVTAAEDQDDYCVNYGVGNFIREFDNLDQYSFYSAPVRKAYWIDLGTKEIKEREVVFDVDEIKAHDPGFARKSQWMQYGCQEGIFNTLPCMIEGKISGSQFKRELQIQYFKDVNASPDGDCGRKVYEYIKGL